MTKELGILSLRKGWSNEHECERKFANLGADHSDLLKRCQLEKKAFHAQDQTERLCFQKPTYPSLKSLRRQNKEGFMASADEAKALWSAKLPAVQF